MKISGEVVRFVRDSIKNVYISIGTQEETSVLEMITEEKLNGWCWESTTFLSIFFQDSDIVCRGYLDIGEDKPYFHSWIEIQYKEQYYVFDPALAILWSKEDYYLQYKVIVKGKVKVAQIKSSLKNLIMSSEEKSIYIAGTEYINNPFFRTNSQVSAEIDGDIFKRISVRFCYNK